MRAIKDLLKSLNVEFDSYANTIHGNRGISIPNTRAPLALDSLLLCEEAEERLGFIFSDLNALFFIFVCHVKNSELSVEPPCLYFPNRLAQTRRAMRLRRLRCSSLEWIGKTIIDCCKFSISRNISWHLNSTSSDIMKCMMQNLPAEYQEDSLTDAFKGVYLGTHHGRPR